MNAAVRYGRYAVQAGEGDPRTDVALRNRIAEANIALVHSVVRLRFPQQSYGAAYDDYVQMGSIGLLRAIEKFDPTVNDNFGAYARTWIRGGISTHLRAYGHHSQKHLQGRWNHQSFTALAAADGDGREFDVAAPADGGLGLHASDVTAMLARVRAVLAEQDHDILVARYIDGRTLADVAIDYGLSREGVRQIEVKALERARRALRAPTARLSERTRRKHGALAA